MSFQQAIADKNKELAIYKEQLNSFTARKQSLAAAKRLYLSHEVGSTEYLTNQRAYYLLLGHPIPLPRQQWYDPIQQSTQPPSLTPSLPPSKKAVPKKKPGQNTRKPKPIQTVAPNSNVKIHNAAKHRIIQNAIQSTFNFKTLAECTGRKFVTREELINAIKGNKILSDYVGDIRKNITKEELCQKLFSKTS